MKAMIVQPMAGKTEEEIQSTRDKAIKLLVNEGYEVIDTYFKEEWTTKEVLQNDGIIHPEVKFLAKSIEKMSECKLIYFCHGWAAARGCKLTHRVAREYFIPIRYEGVQHVE